MKKRDEFVELFVIKGKIIVPVVDLADNEMTLTNVFIKVRKKDLQGYYETKKAR